MNQKILLVLIICTTLRVSHGFRGFFNPNSFANATNTNFTTEEYLAYAKEYAKRYGIPFYRPYDMENVFKMRSKRELENGTVDTQARFLGLLMMPGSSGSYASSNSFYLYGKLVNSAVSLSYAPVQGGNFPNFPRPTASATADDPITPISSPSVPTAPTAPTRVQSVLNGFQRYPTRSGNQYFNTFVPSFYPYYLFPYNFPPRRTNESKSIPIEKLESDSKIG